MARITVTLDLDTTEALAARIDDRMPSLEEVAAQVLYDAARQVHEKAGHSRLCTCGFLEKFAEEPKTAVHFDTQTNEYWITDDPAKSQLIVRYCFFCGGAAPASKRHMLFAHVSAEETSRLSKLCEGISTFEDAIDRLGSPDLDMPGGMMVPIKDDANREQLILLRVITYTQLSDTAELRFTQHRNGNGVSLALSGKCLDRMPPTD